MYEYDLAGLLCTILGQGRVSLGGQCRLPAGYRVRYMGYSSKSLYCMVPLAM